ncbi:serine-rich adhesin for platelets-like [Lineus longissimus]|uniref:serine-rich adhesin for platelets-like n=1 Tax=Lineus longissimus TaxID=88925 RepID=UPI00315C7E03
MLHDLSDLQREDINRRQREVANIPRSIFQPPHRRLVEKEETQKDMETAFEDMFMRQTDQMGDVSLALDPHPVPESPAVSDNLNVSYEDDTEMASHGPEKFEDKRAAALKDITDGLGDKQMDGNKSLKKLMNRIKDQRDAWITQNTQEEPEQDMLQPPATVERSPLTVPSPHDRSPSQYSVTSSETGMSSPGDEVPRPRLAQGVRQVHFGDEGPRVHRHAPSATPKPPVLEPPRPLDDGVLRHPLEEAAKIRAAAQRQIMNVDKQLINFETVRAKEDLDNISIVKHDTSTLGQQARQQRIQLEEHSKEIERKIAELETKRNMIEERESIIKSRPGSLYPHETLPGANQPNYLATSAPAPVSRPGLPVRDPSTRAYDWMAPSTLPARPEVYAAPRPQEDHLQRLRDYQRSLLERHKSATQTPSTSFSSRSDPDASAVSAGYLSSSVYGQPGGRPQYALYPKQDLPSAGQAAQISRPQTVDTSRQYGAVSRSAPVEPLGLLRQPQSVDTQDISRQTSGLDTSSRGRSPEPARRTWPEVYPPIRRRSPDQYQAPVLTGPTPAADLSSATRQLFSFEQTSPKQRSPPRVSPPKVDSGHFERPVQMSMRSPQSLLERPEQRLDETGRFSYPPEGVSDTSEAATRASYPYHPLEESARGTSMLRRVSPHVSPTARVDPPELDDQMKIAEIYERQQQIEQRKEALQRELEEVRRQKKELLGRALEQQASPGENWTQKLQEWMAPLGMSTQGFEATPDRTRASISSEDHTVEIDEKLIEELDQMYSDESSPESEAGKRPRPPPLSKKIVFREDTVPHELSTIPEVETPKSDRTGPSIPSPGTIASASFSTLEPSPRIPSASSTPNTTPSGSPVKLITISKDGDTTISELIQSQRETTPVGSPTSVRKQYLERGYEPSPGGIIHMTPSAGGSQDESGRRSEPSRRAEELSYRTPSPSLVIPPKRKTPVFKEKLDGDDLLKRLSVGKGSQSMRTPPATWSTVLQDESPGLSSGLISSDETRTSGGEDRFSSLTSHTITSTDQSTLQEKSTMSLRERLAAGISGASESSSPSDSHMTGASPMVHLAQKNIEISQYQISSSESEATETTTSSSMITGSSTEMFELMAYTTGTSSSETPQTSLGEERVLARKSAQELTQHTITSQDDTTLMPSSRASPKQDLTQYSIASADETKKSPEERRPKQDLTQYSMVSTDETQVNSKEDLTQYSMVSPDQTRVGPKPDLTQYSFASVEETRPSPSDRESMLQSLIQYTITSGDVTRPSSSEKSSPVQMQDLTQYSIASEDVTRPSPSDRSEKASPMQMQDLTQYTLGESTPSDSESPGERRNVPGLRVEPATPLPGSGRPSSAASDIRRDTIGSMETPGPLQYHDLTQYSLTSQDRTRYSPMDETAKTDPSPSHGQQELTQHSIHSDNGSSTPDQARLPDLTQYSIPSDELSPYEKTNVMQELSQHTLTTGTESAGSDFVSPRSDMSQHAIESDSSKSTVVEESMRKDGTLMQSPQPDLTQISMSTEHLTPKGTGPRQPDLTQYSLISDSDAPQPSVIKSGQGVSLGEMITPKPTEKAAELSQHPITEQSVYPESSPGSSDFSTLTPQDSAVAELTSVSNVPSPDMSNKSPDASISQYPVPLSDLSYSQHPLPQSDLSASQHPIPQSDLSVSQHPVPASDLSASQHPIPPSDVDVTQVPFQTDMSTTQQTLPPSDASISQHSIPDLSVSQHPMTQTEHSISQYPVSEGSDKGTPATSVWLTDASRQTDTFLQRRDVDRQIESESSYLSRRELSSFDYRHDSGSESGESQTDRIVADTKRLREKHFGAKSSEELTFETLSGEEFGIMDEPELTFSSLVSETTSDPGTLTSGAEDEGELTFTGEQSDSLLSFQEHEMLAGEDSLVSLTPETSAMTEEFPDASTSTQGSLQEAFAKRREAFIKKSQRRVKEMKTKPTQEKAGADSLGKTLASWKKSRAINTGTSGGAAAPTAGAKPKIAMTVKTQEDRKNYEKEMKKRTGRLYSNLDEVKGRKAEKDRQKEYKENREKAKEYQKKILEQVRKKGNGNGKK